MDLLIEKYNSNIVSNKIVYDAGQESVLKKLNVLFNRILVEKKKKSLINRFFFKKLKDNLGIYVWGDVGRGKTFLVDMFYSCIPIENKLRIHFHNFMRVIYAELKLHSGIKDPLKNIAKKFMKKYKIICLDEFIVSDIGDAMILSELFKYFFYYEIFFVITSNVVPKSLYTNGLQRQKFIPTIDLIYKRLEVLNILGDLDYRFRSLEKANIFLYPITMFNLKRFRNLFFNLVITKPERRKVISILNRNVKSIYFSDSIVWFDFNVICGDGRSQMDYIELALMFDVVFISNVKSFYFNDDRCKRFITMIDEFYDSKISVIILSDHYFDSLYSGTRLKFEFKRTCSRLFEMGSSNYLKNLKK